VAVAAAAAAAAGVLRPQFILAAGANVALVVVVFMAVAILTRLHVRWKDVRYLKINLKENQAKGIRKNAKLSEFGRMRITRILSYNPITCESTVPGRAFFFLS
jgi:hypothetical protein